MANQWTDFYMITASVMKELNQSNFFVNNSYEGLTKWKLLIVLSSNYLFGGGEVGKFKIREHIWFEVKFFLIKLLFPPEFRLVSWKYSYSGWLYLFLQLNKIVDQPMSYVTDSGEDGFEIAISIIKLVTAYLKYDIKKTEEFEPIISTIFRLMQRFALFHTSF